MTRSVLIIDDDPAILRLLSHAFGTWGWEVAQAQTGEASLELYDRERPDLVLLDFGLSEGNGIDILVQLRQKDPEATIIMLTGYNDVAIAVEAMKMGAENFLTKPVDFAHLAAAVERAYEKVELRRRSRYYMQQRQDASRLELLGSSPAMQEVARKVRLLAGQDTTVLITGETGTGKGWVAQLIHSLSPRADAPFIEINCAGLTSNFLDSELFGHERGAFTDAKTQKRGLFEIADRGTLFLDEIGDLAPELQPKLLKVLENRRFRRLGGTREIEVDVRLIAATNRDLEAEVRAERFREDLYYRLNVLPIHLPPLRERGRRDIENLCLQLLHELHRRTRRGPVHFSPDSLSLLVGYAWPGNIRELKNLLERVVLLAGDTDELRPEHLPAELRSGIRTTGTADDDPADLTLDELERRHILRVLRRFDGNRSRAARALGISRPGLYKKLERFGIPD
ncbi:MAG TPA: sigma-54 dependent transcriptional regulator [Longimicrobiales bacterium]